MRNNITHCDIMQQAVRMWSAVEQSGAEHTPTVEHFRVELTAAFAPHLNFDEDKKLQDRIAETVFDDYIICLEDGRQVILLKRHLSKLGMTVEQYLGKWDLPAHYPTIAPAYSRKRRAMAEKMHLGRHTR